MKLSEKQTFGRKPNEKPDGKRLHLAVDGCAVTLNFSPKAQDALMAEIKQMILSGHAHAEM
jgi:hypothetical protein